MKKDKRRTLLVDKSVQIAILRRVASYWFFTVLIIVAISAFWLVLPGKPTSTRDLIFRWYSLFGPILTGCIFALPLILMDCLRHSNRFAGPMSRLRKEMKRLAEGKIVEPLQFREGDYWGDVADDFNLLIARLEDGSMPKVCVRRTQNDGEAGEGEHTESVAT